MTTQCPYNPAHLMPIQSLLKHLPKCKATNKADFAHCQYNQLHIVLKDTLDSHHQQCILNSKKKQKQAKEDDWTLSFEDSKVQDSSNQEYFNESGNKHRGRMKNAAPPIFTTFLTSKQKQDEEDSWIMDDVSQKESIELQTSKISKKQEKNDLSLFKCSQSLIHTDQKKKDKQKNQEEIMIMEQKNVTQEIQKSVVSDFD